MALAQALRGLQAELTAGRDPSLLRQWAGLVSAYWSRQLMDNAPPRRLDALWRKVDEELAYPWTILELAKRACVSDEHLRRLALAEVGRSPLRQVAWLRLTRATMLLQTTRMKLDEIALNVGYGDAYSFSTAYRRWFGVPPSEVRG
jgi:transcriptional regulator GlxA family with amidase domain